jgi:hypothetical protein
MDTISVYFTKFLGKKILYKNQELTLHAVGLGFLLCMNGNLEFISIPIDECKIICEDKREYFKHHVPSDLVVFKDDRGEFRQANKLNMKHDDEKESKIIKTICQCAGITEYELKSNCKKRKRELVWARQLHMVLRHLFIKKNESLSQTGAIYYKDHATVLHAKKVVASALEGFDVEFRERFREVFELTLAYYPDTAYKKLNLTWL